MNRFRLINIGGLFYNSGFEEKRTVGAQNCPVIYVRVWAIDKPVFRMSIPRKNLSECILNIKFSIDFSDRETYKLIYMRKIQ